MDTEDFEILLRDTLLNYYSMLSDVRNVADNQDKKQEIQAEIDVVNGLLLLLPE